MPAPDVRQKALRQAARLPQLASSTSVVGPGSTTWMPLGPESVQSFSWGENSGRITSLAVAPGNASDVWAGAADGGLWHSIDQGVTWQPVTDTQATLSIGAIAIDGTSGSPYTIYVGTGEASQINNDYPSVGILKSSDGGQTWNTLGAAQFGGLGIARIAIDPTNNQDILVAADLSAFNGCTTPPTGGGPLGLLQNLGIWQSLDGGQTWSHVLQDTTVNSNFAATDVVFDPAQSGVVYAGIGNVLDACTQTASSNAGVWKSTNHGATFGMIGTAGLPTGTAVGRVSLAVSQDGTHIYALISRADSTGCTQSVGRALFNHSFYVSTNSGASWVTQDVSGVPGLTDDDGECMWWFAPFVAVDPSDATGHIVYVGGVDLWKNKGEGASNAWTNVTDSYGANSLKIHPDQHAIAFFTSSSPSFYLGNDGGVWSCCGAGTLNNLNSGLNITQLYGAAVGGSGSGEQLFAGAQDNGTAHDPDNPAHGLALPWPQVDAGDGGRTLVDPSIPSIVYAEKISNPSGNQVEKSVDSGTHWTLIDSGINSSDNQNVVPPFIMSARHSQTLLFGTNKVYVTTNEGSSWQAVSPVLNSSPCLYGAFFGDPTCPLSALAIAPSDENYIYAGDDAGNVYVTGTGGCSTGTCWSGTAVCPTNQMVTSIAVDPRFPGAAYATCAGFASGAGHHVFKTTNGGNTWADVSASLPNIPFESALVLKTANLIAPIQVVVGSDAGVFISPNGGASWAQFGTGLPNAALQQIFTNPGGNQIFVATYGRGMWTLQPPASGWHTVPSPNSSDPTAQNELLSVAVVAANNVWAVGASFGDQQGVPTLIEHWDGAQWHIVANPSTGGTLQSVAAVSASDIWTVGSGQSGPLAEHWNGTAWSIIPTAAAPAQHTYFLNAVATVATNDVWAVGTDFNSVSNTNQTLTEHWNGASWSVASSANASGNDSLFSVATISSGDVWAVGQYIDDTSTAQTLAEHWNGSSWTVVPTPTGAGNSLNAVTAIASNDVWGASAAPSSSGELIEHWNGTNWQVVPGAGGRGSTVYSLAAVGTHDVWAVGQRQGSLQTQEFIEHWDGTSWIVSFTLASDFNSYYGLGIGAHGGLGNVWAVGDVQGLGAGNGVTLTQNSGPYVPYS